MSFTSKRLRVQLPCGEQTVVEIAGGDGPPCLLDFASPARQPAISPRLCQQRFATVGPQPDCPFPLSLMHRDRVVCRLRSVAAPLDQREVLVAPEHLDALHASLSDQLEALTAAGEQVKARIDELEQARAQLEQQGDGG